MLNNIRFTMYTLRPLLFWNCRFLVDELQAAIEVHKGADGMVSHEEVVRGVRVLMGEPEGDKVRANVGKLRDKMKEAVSKDGSVQRHIIAFLAEVTPMTV